jgi:gas vesicle protein
MRHHDSDEPVIIIEKHNDIGSLFIGVLIGAGVALLFAPRSGAETRAQIKRKARQAGDAVKGAADDVTYKVTDTFEQARARVEEQIESARNAIEIKKQQVTRAVEAGRDAAAQAREDLESRLAQTKAAYNAGADVARDTRRQRPVSTDTVV